MGSHLRAPRPSRSLLPPLWAVFALAALAWLAPARAAWVPDGVPLTRMPVPVPPFETFSFMGMAPDGAQGAYVVWEFTSWRPEVDPTSYIYAAQRVDALGNRPAPWTEAGAPMLSFNNMASFGPYALTPLGMFEDGAGGAVFAVVTSEFNVEPMNLFRLFHIDPSAVAGPMPMEYSFFNGFPVTDVAVAPTQGGGVIAVLLSQTFAPPPEPHPASALHAIRMDASGQQLWDDGMEIGPVLAPPGQAGGGLAALADGAGGGYFAWVDRRDATDPDVYLQHLDADGAVAPGWPDGGLLVCGAAGAQFSPHLAPDGAGGAFVQWLDRRAPQDRLYAHHVSSSGVLAAGVPVDGRMLPSSIAHDAFSRMSGDGFTGCFILSKGATASLVPLRLHRLDGDLLPVGDWPSEGALLSIFSLPSVTNGLVPDGTGGAYVTFRNGFGSSPDEGLWVLRIGPDGSPASGWPAAGYRLSAFGLASGIVRSAGGAIAAWTDSRESYPGVYAQRVLAEGPVVSVPALESRSTSVALSLRSPQPSSGSMSFSVSLPDARGARLDLMDIAGRRVTSRELAGLGSGTHVVILDEATSLVPGLYVARLSGAAGTRSVRILRLR